MVRSIAYESNITIVGDVDLLLRSYYPHTHLEKENPKRPPKEAGGINIGLLKNTDLYVHTPHFV